MILAPFLFKKDLESLKNVNKLYIVTLIFLAFVILIEAPFFRNNYVNHNDSDLAYSFNFIKPLDMNFFSIVFSFLGCFYCHPFVLSIRNQLLSPSLKRKFKVSLLSSTALMALFIFFGGFVYFCFGDGRIPKLIILRLPFKGKSYISELIFFLAIFLFFALTNIGLCVFNP